MGKKTDFFKSVASLSAADLDLKIKEDQLRLKKLEFAHAIKPIENPMLIRTLRRDIARLQSLKTANNNN
jgi:large subunit ribosomal protein L29